MISFDIKTLLVLNIALLLVSCVNNSSKKNLVNTIHICGKLHVEVYKVFASGAHGGDLIAEYLTDSTNFRKYIGTYDDGFEIYTYSCDETAIVVRRIKREVGTKNKEISRIVLDLKTLRNSKTFE
jgi:hypothetical protein